MKSRTPLPELKSRLAEAISARGTAYTHKELFIFYFAADDTGAEADAKTLSACFEDVFGFANINIMKIPRNDRMPAFSVEATLTSICARIGSPNNLRPSLLVIAYIGHASIDPGAVHPRLASGHRSQNVEWSFVHERYFSDSPMVFNIDTLGFLDCCSAVSSRTIRSRTSQLIAASGPNEIARSRDDGFITFTQRFSRAARQLRNKNMPFTTTDLLMEELHRELPPNAPAPILKVLGGVDPIAFAFKDRRIAETSDLNQISLPAPATTLQNVLVELSFAGEADEVLEEYKAALMALPSQFGVTIVDAYSSTSVLSLVRMNWSTYSRLSASLDLHLIGVVSGPSLINSRRLL